MSVPDCPTMKILPAEVKWVRALAPASPRPHTCSALVEKTAVGCEYSADVQLRPTAALSVLVVADHLETSLLLVSSGQTNGLLHRLETASWRAFRSAVFPCPTGTLLLTNALDLVLGNL